MIPLIQREAVQRRGWVTEEDIVDIVAIAESTPGPIAVNAATFVGYRAAGCLGAICATLGVVLPSFLVILGVSYILRAFQENRFVRYAFTGIRACVLALILKALWGMGKKQPKTWVSCAIMACSFLLVAVWNASVLPVLIACACAGLVSAWWMERKAGR